MSSPVPFVPLSAAEIEQQYDFTPPDGDMFALDWSSMMLESGFYEYPTSEFVDGISHYLAERTAVLGRTTDETIRIVEVAAGNGIFNSLVSQALAERDVCAEVTATDNASYWNIEPLPHVQIMDYQQAVTELRPHIVIGSWIPDAWDQLFRQVRVPEYVLIGKTEGGGRHAKQSTWGRNEIGERQRVPDYNRDGYQRINLRWLQPFQFCYRSITNNLHQSETIVFRNMRDAS